MSITRHCAARGCVAAIAVLAVGGLLAAIGASARAQGVVTTRAVGGISINAEGLLDNARTDDSRALSRLRREALHQAPGDLNKYTELRMISLRRLEAAVQRHLKDKAPLPDEIQYMAGLQQVRYVFVDPEQKDIILAGPAEGWKVDDRGFVVGRTTGRPVLLLDDLVVALRAAGEPAGQHISCSINPTDDGLKRLRAHVAKLRTIGDPKATIAGIEAALGPQRITVEGVPATSHFARVLVAADYRMKRIGMDLDPSPVHGLTSYMQLIGAGPQGVNSLLPRWWLEPRYEAIVRDEDGLAWELRGAGVKTLTEEDYQSAAGNLEQTGKAGPAAQRWADLMTAKFPELAVADPVFGQLRNCMDLALVATLISKEGLAAKSGWAMTVFGDPSALAVVELPAPKEVPTKASPVQRGRNWVIAASGGVMISPRAALKQARIEAELKARRIESALGKHDDWWWN